MTDDIDRPIRLGVLISGGGTTLTNLLARIDAGELQAEVTVVIASRADCRGLEKAEAANVPCHVVRRKEFEDDASFSGAIFDHCRAGAVDLVVLAGFLSRIDVPADFHQRVMNIHPALIPAFCGHGMYGRHVHEAVLARGCKVSGCTVHFADNEYDHGPVILQRCVPVHDDDTGDSLAARVFEAECEAYPEAIRLYRDGRLRVVDRRVLVSPRP